MANRYWKGMDPTQAFLNAAQDLNIQPGQARGHLSQIGNYLNTKGLGWTAVTNDAQAGDYFGVQGGGNRASRLGLTATAASAGTNKSSTTRPSTRRTRCSRGCTRGSPIPAGPGC